MQLPTNASENFGRRSMVMMNGGLGNGFIIAPLLAALERHFHPFSYFTAPNSALESAWVRAALKMHGAVGTFSPLWRRFAESDRSAFWDFADAAGVDLIVNLRKEFILDDGNYLSFRDQAVGRGVECWDLHELGPEEARLPIGDQAAAVLRRHGVSADFAPPAWLSAFRRPRAGVVGCYVGASTAVKRWPARDWAALAAGLRHRRREIEIAAGPDEQERAIADSLARSGAVRPRPVFLASLEDMRDWIASLEVLISNDTATVHLATALGCPVVGLYLATDGAIWSPRSAPGRLAVVQSQIALSCPQMKPDGTCRRFYSGCPAPCASGVRPADVLAAFSAIVEPNAAPEEMLL
jgi:hypothetical protein